MSYLEKIKHCNRANLDHYLPLLIAEQQYGWVHKTFAEHLKNWTDIFQITDSSIIFNTKFSDYQTRSQAIAPVLTELHQQGIIDTWVGEPYPVNHKYGEKGVMEIERAAALYFGTRCYGVHINGLVKKYDGIYVWIAVRAKDKPFFPSQLDQIVAGGQPVGISLMDNVIKESQEEANIPHVLASQAQARGYLSYQMETSRGIESSTLFNYDCWLPEDFVPENTDGEVDSFRLVSLEELAELTKHSDDFKDNCNLTNIDLLIRSGVIDDKHPDYQEITQRLYSD